MFLGYYTIFKGLAAIFVLFGLASSLAFPKIDQTEENAKAESYNVHRSRWTARNLTYKILNYPEGLSQADCDSEIKLAFDLWSQHANLTFTQIRTTEPVHIEIKFVHGEHGDREPLKGGILAHAYAPMYGGDIHIDSSRKWSGKYGLQLSRVAAQVIGTSLGLELSRNRSSIMYVIYESRDPLQLSADDIENIQKVYGKKTTDSEHIARIES